ncbi:NAD(P)H-dependent oxidoreductase [Glaciimonas sp. CA11.2]|uniref:NAD(P)H-dependent oxidoreductase n=1 Tax=unclassified Glaciimonas TaxID=2644401 RepID=UPI002AB50A2E|nr:MULTISPECIES: NAD(P)H-dependent oxidoreductase [unclassified Glaciimonas]MDY7545107.1 NAD(P)H-dependent oxidoreductase [Glaciimonas sp. CA11.2]MEB0011425.1 NAD(P)H-dependent oxidoreductase [Glaciimonas sp. Cout2]MEB0081076.1 NAD(P)H-dependent oxidoreductase [Glaciimonas sp. Gout2]MEB0163784.1 NAD(P)H-dependent oxidoreductase [Glaciimonas sp. CA11.2]
MKKVHVVYCHPEPKSFVGSMRDTVCHALSESGWQVTLSDLHASQFNPVASAADFGQRERSDHLVYSLEQRHGWQHKTIAKDIAAEVEKIVDAELLVLVFPLFWYSMPAQLKGWVDRVFLSGTFFGGRRIYDQGGMVGKRAMVVTSLGGQSHMFGPEAIHGELNGMLRHLLQGTLGYVGFDVCEPFYAHHVPYVDDQARGAMLDQLDREMRVVDRRPTLPMPSLEAFDEQFRPRVTKPSY